MIRLLLCASFCVPLSWASSALAAVISNPGGDTVVTNSTTVTAVYIPTYVTQQTDAYASTISAIFGGNTVFSASFTLPFSNPAVQAAVVMANLVLTADGAVSQVPTLVSYTTTISATAPLTTPNLSCTQLLNGGYGAYAFTHVTQTQMFGPVTINTGSCNQDTLSLLPGQLDININAELGINVPVVVTTTDTLLTTQLYQITGSTSQPVSTTVPEPSTMALVLTGCAFLGVLRRRKRLARNG